MAHTHCHQITPKSATTFAEALELSSENRSTTVHKTSDRFQAVKLRQDANHQSSKRKALSVPDQFQQTCIEFAGVVALKHQNIGQDTWHSVNYSQYHVQVLRAAKMFIKLGLEPHNGVGILANNSPEWFYSSLGAIHAGGLSTGIYTTNSSESVFHVLNDSSANIVVVDNNIQMKKIREIRHRLPNLKAAIQTHGPYEDFVDGTDGYYRWSKLMETNHDDQEPELINRVANIRVNECCNLVYTSGTVGNPKGVMMSHDNLTWSTWSWLRSIPNIQPGKEVIVSYLPLSHTAAQIFDILFGATTGVTIYFADKDALKFSLIKTLTVAQPTRFFGVPRVFEKIYEKMLAIEAKATGVPKVLINWGKSHTLQHWLDHISGSPSETLQCKLARYMIIGQVKKALGFSRCQSIMTAAAPLSMEIKKHFLSLDMTIMEAFGMSETCGAHCMGLLKNYNLTTLGSTAEGQETKVINQDEKGHGEILMKGRHICMGYLNEPTKTDEALDDEGFIHSGDLGYVDQAGLMYITGRLKDLIITAGGENVPPSKIEHTIRNELQVLSNVFLVGDKRKFLSCLVTLKTELDFQTGEPKDELLQETITWLKSLGVSYKNLSEIIAAGPCPKVLTAIEDAIKRANKLSISNAQKVQKFTLLPRDFSFVGGELGPTLKVKRNVVSSKYEGTIEKLYVN